VALRRLEEGVSEPDYVLAQLVNLGCALEEEAAAAAAHACSTCRGGIAAEWRATWAPA
jgi:hypothetical protein